MNANQGGKICLMLIARTKNNKYKGFDDTTFEISQNRIKPNTY